MTVLKCCVCGAHFECRPRGDEMPLMCDRCLMRLRKLVEQAS